MKQVCNFTDNIASGQKITTKGRFTAYSDVVFLFPAAPFLQGVLHSSSLPDYIEDKKSGGQKTDCLKNICAMIQLSTQDLQNRKIKQMLKTVMRG